MPDAYSLRKRQIGQDALQAIDAAASLRCRRTIIVVPCYNEESRLDVDVFRSFACRNDDILFILVDDGSSDGTLQVLSSLQELDPECFEILALDENQGKAEAVRRGMLRAFEHEPVYIGFWDADLATPLESIPDFIDVLDESPEIKVVTGARVKLLGRRIERRARRHYLGRIFATVVSLLLRLGVYDTQCGAKVFRAAPDVYRLFSRRFFSNWIFDVEIIARLVELQRESRDLPVQKVIYEYPLMQWIDVDGSKVDALAYISSLLDLLKIWYRYKPSNAQAYPHRAKEKEVVRV